MMAMPAARKYEKEAFGPDSPAEWGGAEQTENSSSSMPFFFFICHNNQQSVGTHEFLAVAFAATHR